MKSFYCECKKTGTKLLEVLAPVLTLILAWSFWIMRDPDEQIRVQGYTYLLNTILMLNVIFLPAAAAVMASRMIDMETRGNTYKLLFTLQRRTSLFRCKLLLASLHLLAFFLLETAGFWIIGRAVGFTQPFPASDYLQLQGIGFLTALLLTVLQMFFSLQLENQLYPLFIGVLGCFVGLFSMFLPIGSFFFYLIPWSYFTFGCPVQMQWDETTKIYSFPRIPFNCVGLAVVLFVLFALCVAVNRCFSRKEV